MNAPANKLNVHFDHRICLFLSDLLLMSDFFHVPCALHFYSLSEFKGTSHACTPSFPAQAHIHFCTFIILQTAWQIQSTHWCLWLRKILILFAIALYACGLAWQIKYHKKMNGFSIKQQQKSRKEKRREERITNQQHELNRTKHCV